MQGVAHTQYRRDGVTFTRDLVVSKPDEVIAISLKADKPGALSCTAALVRKQNAATHADNGVFVLEGQLPFNKPGGGGQGMRYLALLGVKVQGGKVSADRSGSGGRRRRRGDVHGVGRHRLEGQRLCRSRSPPFGCGPRQAV